MGNPRWGNPTRLEATVPARGADERSGGTLRRAPDGTAVEEGRRAGLLRCLEDDLRALLRPRTVGAAVVEAVWVSLHLAMYPWGVLRDRPQEHDHYHLGGLAPHQRGLVVGDVEAAGTPILLVHGMLDNRAIFAVLRSGLRRRGFRRIFAINYSPLTNDIREAAQDLSRAIEELVARTGYERIHVIGHSLGGLIARYYVQRLGGDERVHTLVTLGTPHSGTLPAYAAPFQLGVQLRPGSRLLAELDEPAAACRTRFVAYWSDLDQMIVPHANGRIDHPDLTVRNVHVQGVGHMSLPIQGRVVRDIAGLLSQLDAEGATVRAGVTSLSGDLGA